MRALISIYESRSRTTRLKPISIASSRARLTANASTSMAVKGRRILWERETMTCPLSFLFTTSILQQFSSWKREISKLILYWQLSGGFQCVGGRPTGETVDVLWSFKSRNLCYLTTKLIEYHLGKGNHSMCCLIYSCRCKPYSLMK